jgi:hypothetical protein
MNPQNEIVAGKPAHANKLSRHLGEEIDGACMINKAGATAAMAIGGVVGMAATAALRRRPQGDEIKVTGNGWLAVGRTGFALVAGDKLLGNPKGEPIAQVAFADVEAVHVKQGKVTARADVTLADGRSFAFETKRKGPNKGNPAVLALLAARCA